MAERLQKWLAGRGHGSRREIERWIAAGRIAVDGRTAELGQKVSGDERITLDGQPLMQRAPGQHRFLIYHKPAGEICSRADPQGRPTVFDRLPRLRGARWISVGRLDLQTSGLLLFTTDGALANRLLHPSAGLEREYAVRVQGAVDKTVLRQLRHGLELDDGPARFERAEFAGGGGSNQWYRVIVTEGRNRLVRRLWKAAGCRVTRLIRVRFGPLVLPRDLARGRFRRLDQQQVRALREGVER